MNPSLKKHNDLYVALKGLLEASIAFREGKSPYSFEMMTGVGICGNLRGSYLAEEEVNYFMGALCGRFSQTGSKRYPVMPPLGCPLRAYMTASPWEMWGGHPYAANRRKLLRDCIRYLEIMHGDTSFFTKACYLLTIKFWRL